MKFSYSAFLSPAADTGEEVIIFRPEVPLRIFGESASAVYMALVDTGADNTILPLSIARELEIIVHEAKGPGATAFGGQLIPLSYADVEIQISDERDRLRWHARIHFLIFPMRSRKPSWSGTKAFLTSLQRCLMARK